MGTAGGYTGVGPLLREWRQRRRLTQMELALETGVSARHLSFVETGRSKPGREMLLRVADQLEMPFRERNQLLLTAGHAPAFPERNLEDSALEPVREALDRILAAHEPYPAIVFDRMWNLVAANAPMSALAERVDIDPALLAPPVNVLRVGLHPRGLAPLIVNLADWRAHFLERLARQVAITGDPALRALTEEIAAYPIAEGDNGNAAAEGARDLLGPVRFRAPTGGEWSFFGMFAGFDTPFEVTTSELAVELLFPADRTTADAFKKGTS
jgi:transcriptional regulator with XRE-family HTH domain